MRALIVMLRVALFGAIATLLMGATTPNTVVNPITPNRGIVQFLQGTDAAGTYKTLYTAGANGSKCTALWLTSNDPTSHLVTIQIVNGGVKYGGVAVTTGTTTPGFASGAPAINALAVGTWTGLPRDSDGNPFFIMVNGDTLQATFATALTASDVINGTAVCSDF